MTLLSEQPEPRRAQQRSRADWVQAALDVLVDRGVDGVQITHLSKSLAVTRGSFYWHFENREELLEALLAEWRARNTGVMVDALANAHDLDTGILDLFAVWVDHTRFDPRLDQAVRDWARRDGTIAETLNEEDNNRVAAIARFFERMMYEPTEAFIRARVIYFTQISYYALGVQEPLPVRASYLAAYFRSFTGREIDPASGDAFLARMGAKTGAAT